MMRLLFQRGSVLLLRPAAVLAEGAVVPGGNVLIHALPIAAMALTVSSIPVYLQFMAALPGQPERAVAARAYVGGLINVTILSLAVLCAVLLTTWTTISATLLVSIGALFVVEKFSDELTRYYEFGKRYNLWFMVQVIRSAWLFLPVLLSLLGAEYGLAFAATALFTAAVSITLFFVATGLKPRFCATGWGVMRSNSVFWSGSILIALHRQGPRIVVAHLFPQVAHFYQAIAQIGQGVALLFNVKYQIPYRALIARRPASVERLFNRDFRRLLWLALGLGAVALFIRMVAMPDSTAASGHVGGTPLLTLALIMIGDALAFALLSAYLGYLPWLGERRRAFVTYALSALLMALVAAAGYTALTMAPDFMLIVPASSILLATVWILLLRHRHFNTREQHV